MKRLLAILCVTLMFAGCASQRNDLDRVMNFRASLLSSMGCNFRANITADYQDELYQFSLDCRTDEKGTLYFTVLEPESISGISGVVDAEGGKLTFDNDRVLAFNTMADGQVTPVTAPWLLIKALRGGYISSCGIEDDTLRASIDDSYQEDALRLDVWFSADDVPNYAEILWADRRILSLEVVDLEKM